MPKFIEDQEALKARVMQVVGSVEVRPLNKVELSKELNLKPAERRQLHRVLNELEQAGKIARIRKDRYILPEPADLFTGIIHVHPDRFAFILSEQPGQGDLFIAAANTGTARHGDRVVARILRRGLTERRGGRPSARGSDRQEGTVIRILERASNNAVGTLRTSKNFFFVEPDDARMVHNIYVQPRVRATGETALPGQKVVVRLDDWDSPHLNPEGEIIEILGRAEDPGVDMLSIIRKYNLPGDFPKAAAKEADQLPARIPDAEIRRRRDCRKMEVATIDPDDAKDFDDAIHVEKVQNGWRLSVFIADVSHYVKPGTALDREAAERGNSVYMVDRVIPMLPERLSNDLCSLKPKVDRLAMAAFLEFDTKGRVKKSEFGPAVIRSRRRFTYAEALKVLHGKASGSVERMLKEAWKLASILRANRFEKGSLDLDFPEIKVRLDKNGRPLRIDKLDNDESHQLIEEFMLAANEAVAREIKRRSLPSIYRIHEEPDPQRLEEFADLARSYGARPGNLVQRNEVRRFLKSIRGKAEEYPLKLGFLKSLKRASYSTEPAGHYGLAKEDYTHFTSPIRRYADLVVHRVVMQLLGRKVKTATQPLTKICDAIVTTEKAASDAERESVKLKQLEYFDEQTRKRRPDSFQAVVIDVRNYGLLVELPDHMITGLIHVSALPDDFFIFDAGRFRFIGRRSRRVFQLGQKLKVNPVRVDIGKRQVDFVVA